MAYPTSLDELTDGVPSDGTAPTTALNDATYPHDDHHRNLAIAVEAVETELGLNPSGASATVVARLDALDTSLAATRTTVTVGATNADYTTLALAFAAYPSGGVEFYVRPGTYAAANLQPPPSCTVTLSPGAVLRLPNNSGGQNVISVPLASTDVTIRGGKIDGNKANQGVSLGNGIAMFGPRQHVDGVHVVDVNGYGIVGFAGADEMTVRGCVVEDSYKEGIEVQACSRAVIVGNEVIRAGYTGIYAWANTAQGGTCSDVTIVGNVVNAPGSGVAAFGIRADDGATNVTVAGNVVTNAGTAVSYGIGAFSSTSSAVSKVAITGNTVTGANFAAGIYVAKATAVTVAQNAVSATAVGIQFTATTSEVVCDGNTVVSTTNNGIYCVSSANAAISNNIVKSCGGTTNDSIKVDAVTNVSIVGNVLSSGGAAGILLTNSCNGFTVSGNTCYFNRTSGIYMLDSSNGVVVGNTCRANGTSAVGSVIANGITVYRNAVATANIAISGNRCYDDQGTKTQLYGVRLYGAVDSVALSGNVLAGNLTGNLSVDTTATNVTSQRATFGPRSVDPRFYSGTAAPGASRCVYLRAEGSGVISKIAVDIGVSAGNICVGVYANSGAGTAARPAAQKATSGSVASPGTGYREIALTSSVYVEEGDWLAVAADDGTATFTVVGPNGASGSMAAGLSHFQTTTFPLPGTAAPSGTNAIYSVILVGVA